MNSDLDRVCEECGSVFIAEASQMEALCAECAHLLYGYPRCAHEFVGGACRMCGWNRSRSAYTLRLSGEADSVSPGTGSEQAK